MHRCRIVLDRSFNADERPCHRFIPVNLNDADVKILTCSMMSESTGYSFIDIVSRTGELVDSGRHVYEDGECNIMRIANDHYLAMVTNCRCTLARLINKSGCFLTSALPVTDTLIEWTIIGPDRTKIGDLFEDMRAAGYHFDMVSSEFMEPKTIITSKQRDYFTLAWKLGYYDIPKRIDLDQLSRIAGVSKSTLNVSLRTAERNIFEFYLAFCDSGRFLGNEDRTCS